MLIWNIIKYVPVKLAVNINSCCETWCIYKTSVGILAFLGKCQKSSLCRTCLAENVKVSFKKLFGSFWLFSFLRKNTSTIIVFFRVSMPFFYPRGGDNEMDTSESLL